MVESLQEAISIHEILKIHAPLYNRVVNAFDIKTVRGVHYR